MKATRDNHGHLRCECDDYMIMNFKLDDATKPVPMFFTCPNPTCAFHGKNFKIPVIELEEAD